ncbi:hypothetical protein SAMN02745823_03805 [Sporobacter termitidis DSM 10068]|uniref:Uncharacterized protein n=1 Tax=Sporobacter termitidis DSM 10068 TaxID=1123282 RepID=A0A1M5ZIV3_9FIRM|nr:hypothetical protein [Sporobacter termitidis]SHI24142.1 hypothetical protein SAMN02745823_03805 [Sporobacter termitidis DSM 10068]
MSENTTSATIHELEKRIEENEALYREYADRLVSLNMEFIGLIDALNIAWETIELLSDFTDEKFSGLDFLITSCGKLRAELGNLSGDMFLKRKLA